MKWFKRWKCSVLMVFGLKINFFHFFLNEWWRHCGGLICVIVESCCQSILFGAAWKMRPLNWLENSKKLIEVSRWVNRIGEKCQNKSHKVWRIMLSLQLVVTTSKTHHLVLSVILPHITLHLVTWILLVWNINVYLSSETTWRKNFYSIFNEKKTGKNCSR